MSDSEQTGQPAHGTILVVDDDVALAEMLVEFFRTAGFEVRCVHSGADALAELGSGRCDLLLSDITMPGMTGLELLAAVRSDSELFDLPVILMSALDTSRHVVDGLQAGANDYITKPLDYSVLLARVETQVAMAKRVANLEVRTDQLFRLATIDPLTGAYNRRALIDLLEKEFERSRRHKHPLSVLMLDLDGFKQVNDEYGHTTGDEVLVEFVKRCRAALRGADILTRYGGDEFFIIFPETSGEMAKEIALRVCTTVSAKPVPTVSGDLPTTVTIGVGVLSDDMSGVLPLIAMADKALYNAKRLGKNRVGTAEQDA